jgi:hypothetical protein
MATAPPTTAPPTPGARLPGAVNRPGGAPAKKTFTRTTGVARRARKVGIYGPGGVGKTSLAAVLRGIVFADIELSSLDMDVQRDEGIKTWEDLRAWAQQLTPDAYPAGACIDSMTRAEDWCAEYVIRTKKSNDGVKATDSLEDFKYKAGLQFVVEEFRRFLADLDNAFLRGVSLVMIAHNRISKFKNVDGSDYIREEPRLMHTEDKGSNMAQWIEFCDEVVYVGMDTIASKGKATGSGTRTLYFAGTPSRVAKTRVLPYASLVYERGSDQFWELLAGRGTAPADDMPPV